MLLTAQLGREAAQRAVSDAIEKVHERRQPLENILNINLGSAEEYLGSSEVFRRKLLEDVE
jgi:hypothetical protein